MIRKTSSFLGQIGWRQGNCPVTLDATNLGSTSGKTFDQYSALVSAATLYDVWPEYDTADDTSTKTTKFNDWLTKLQQGAIDQVMHSIFGQHCDLLQNDFLYKWEQDFNTLIDNNGDFVGFKVEVTRDRRFVTIINKVFATFNGVETFNLYLFNTSKKDPIQTQSITTVADDTIEVELGWALDPDYAGDFYIGYLTSGLTAKAYDRQYELANLTSRFVHSFWEEIKIPGHTTATLFDVNDEVKTSDSYGLNFDVSAFSDFTQIALPNKNQFLEAIGLQVAVNALDVMINTTRSNRNERISRADALLVLEGNSNPNFGLLTTGLRQRLFNEIESKRKLFVKEPRVARATLS